MGTVRGAPLEEDARRALYESGAWYSPPFFRVPEVEARVGALLFKEHACLFIALVVHHDAAVEDRLRIGVVEVVRRAVLVVVDDSAVA